MSVKFLFTSARMLGYWDGNRQHKIRARNCYGLTWNETDVFYSYTPPDDARSSVKVLGRDCLDFDRLHNVHQMLWYGNNLYITNTGRDSGVCRHWSLCLCAPDSADVLHINSLFGYDGKLFILESGLGGTCRPAAISILDRGQIVERILLDTDRVIFCHNLYLEDGFVYGCFKDDAAQRVGVFRKQLDGGCIEYVPLEDYSRFPRGLARDDGHFYVGISESRPRPERVYGDSKVLILDDDLRPIDAIPLENTGQLCGLRLATGDRAHNGLDVPHEKLQLV